MMCVASVRDSPSDPRPLLACKRGLGEGALPPCCRGDGGRVWRFWRGGCGGQLMRTDPFLSSPLLKPGRPRLQSKTESTAIMSFIRQCASKVELSISFYDTSRNEHIKERRARMEQEAREGKAKQERMEQDYLSPFLVQLDDPDNLTEKDAVWLVDQCKKDLRVRVDGPPCRPACHARHIAAGPPLRRALATVCGAM